MIAIVGANEQAGRHETEMRVCVKFDGAGVLVVGMGGVN